MQCCGGIGTRTVTTRFIWSSQESHTPCHGATIVLGSYLLPHSRTRNRDHENSNQEECNRSSSNNGRLWARGEEGSRPPRASRSPHHPARTPRGPLVVRSLLLDDGEPATHPAGGTQERQPA